MFTELILPAIIGVVNVEGFLPFTLQLQKLSLENV